VTTINIPLTTLAPGTYHFTGSIADSERTATLSIDRTVASGFNSKTPATQAALNVYQSDNSGATWFFLAGCTIEGGSVTDPSRTPPGPYTTSSVTVNSVPGTGREVKAEVVISGTSVAVQGSLVVQ
jgi:hypothetical protein